MRTSQAARYARWSAIAAFVLTAIVAGAYFYRSLQARQLRKHAPPSAPVAVQRQSSGFSFSKEEGNRTIFTVSALKATEFKGSDRNILEDVIITIFGREGDRNDRIHTKSCEFQRDTGGIVCAGEVQMDLQSAQDARRQSEGQPHKSADGIIHIGTRNVIFHRETGEARTDQDVVIEFPEGVGRAKGVSYHSSSGIVRLEKNVEVTLTSVPEGKSAAKKSSSTNPNVAPLKITGSKLEFMREAGLTRLSGPVHAIQGDRELNAGRLDLELDSVLHVRTLSALSGGSPGQRPVLVSRTKNANGTIIADALIVSLHPQGWIEKVRAQGAVRGDVAGPKGEEHLEASKVELDMGPKTRKPQRLQASERVFAEVKAAANGAVKRLRTDALLVNFVPGQRTRVDSAETLSAGTLEWEGARQDPASNQESTRLSGQKIKANFNPKGQPEALLAHGQADVERHVPGRPAQLTSSNDLQVKFAKSGDWSEMVFDGDVKLKEGERAAQASKAQLSRSAQTAILSGNAVVTDAMTRTTAQRISFMQATGEIRGEGQVASTDLAAGRGVVNLAPLPANITSDRLAANSVTGHALYSGNARLWQGDSVIQADSIELLRDVRELHALGNVVAEFPQTGNSASAGTSSAPGISGGLSGTKRVNAATTKRWRILAGKLTYWGKESRARLEDHVHAKSQQEEIIAPVMEVYFSSTPSGERARQLSRAVATGGVVVQEGERRGTAEQGEYIASEGKFTLSGGQPTLTGAFGDTTTGRKLTFFLADDTIVVDSENGTRTLTKHRVKK